MVTTKGFARRAALAALLAGGLTALAGGLPALAGGLAALAGGRAALGVEASATELGGTGKTYDGRAARSG
ncbi:MAG: hypothetical protein JO120_08840 [Solirubrobacterales bacterium]|nr:hypothetical protein [Solirubrobacterales bacterium]